VSASSERRCDQPIGPLQVPFVGLQVLPAGQQAPQPHNVWSGAHSGAHWPPTQVYPQPQVCEQLSGTQTLPLQPSPEGHAVQVPPQPSDWPQVLPTQLGAQQAPW
jgi:hypothetical protein